MSWYRFKVPAVAQVVTVNQGQEGTQEPRRGSIDPIRDSVLAALASEAPGGSEEPVREWTCHFKFKPSRVRTWAHPIIGERRYSLVCLECTLTREFPGYEDMIEYAKLHATFHAEAMDAEIP